MTWAPFPAGHWPQEPNGFQGLKFDATPAEAGQTTQLENWETVEYGNLRCNAALVLAGKTFQGNILFATPHNPKTRAPVGEGRLAQIYAEFDSGDFAFVKTAFVEMYGPPHETDANGMLKWIGNKAEIRLNAGFFWISPNMAARGATLHVAMEFQPLPEEPKPPAFERYTETARRVLFFARYEASRRGSPVIEPEHLLLGVIREQETLPYQMPCLDADLASLRSHLESRMTIRPAIPAAVSVPFSQDSNRALAHTVEEAAGLQHDFVLPAHMVLGLLRLETSATASALQRHGISYAAYRDKVRAP